MTFTYLKNLGHTGSKSAKVQISSYTDGDAKWVFNNLTVTPGESYMFSDWYQSNVPSYVVVYFALTNGTDYYLGLRTAPPSATWAQFTEPFQVPYNAKTMTIYHLINSVGWLTIDDSSAVKFTPRPLNRALVTLAFDDGWEDDTMTVLPVLQNYGYHATFFFATTFLQHTPATGPINVSGPTAVKTIFQQGHEIGGHTVTHPDLTTVSASKLNKELTDSKTYLESLVGAGNVKNFASPYGAYNDAVLAATRPLYKSHRPTDEGFNTPENFDPYRLKVQNMQVTTTLADFQGWINQAVKDKSWLILVYHRVASSDLDRFDTPQADFQPQMEIIKKAGITVKTMDQALDEVSAQVTP